MKTKYLDNEIELLNSIKRNHEISDYGQEKLNEFMAIKKQLLLHNVSQAKRTVCPDCGDYGWIYSEDGTSRKTCPCHY